ncbi:MAG: helix-turn-helix domain-containing protein [Sphingobacterium sp.]|nr:helix-turn-helix domain-containing protein [Sphingobacterium sp.]
MMRYERGNFGAFETEIASENEVIFFSLKEVKDGVDMGDPDFFTLLLLESGSGIHKIDFLDFTVRPKQFHFVQPQQIHTYQFNDNVMGYGVMVHRKFFELFSNGFHFALPLYMKHPVLELREVEFKNLKGEFEGIRQEVGGSLVFRELVVARFFVIACLISRISKHYFENLPITKGNPKLYKFLGLIEEYFHSNRKPAFYAGKLNITVSYLNSLCKRYFHCTSTNMIENRIVLEAKRFLISGLSIKETAKALSFRDVSYFIRYFRVHTKSTPKRFRALYGFE